MTRKELRDAIKKAFVDGTYLGIMLLRERGAPSTKKEERSLMSAARSLSEDYWKMAFVPILEGYTLTVTRCPRPQKEKGRARQDSAKKKR